MIITIMLVILGIALLMKQWKSTAEPTGDRTGVGSPAAFAKLTHPGKSRTDSEVGQVWSALDDLQLTRLLTDSAPPNTSEQDLT